VRKYGNSGELISLAVWSIGCAYEVMVYGAVMLCSIQRYCKFEWRLLEERIFIFQDGVDGLNVLVLCIVVCCI